MAVSSVKCHLVFSPWSAKDSGKTIFGNAETHLDISLDIYRTYTITRNTQHISYAICLFLRRESFKSFNNHQAFLKGGLKY